MIVATIAPNMGDAELRDSKDPFWLLFESSNDAVLLCSAEGIIEAANPAACRLFGWPKEAVRQIGLTALVDPADGRLSVLLKEQEQTGRFKGELNFKRKDGSVFLGEVCGGFYKDNLGIGKATFIIRDISERQPIEETLRHITEGTAGSTGDEFFHSLVKHVSQALQVRYCFVAECADETDKRVRMFGFLGRARLW